jgi:hypothetical protein
MSRADVVRESEIDPEEDGEGAETSPDDEEEVAEAPPRARPRAVLRSGVAPSIFGAVPERATAWGLKRRTPIGQWETLSFAVPGGMAELKEWPLGELAEVTVRNRWGAGTFRVLWWGTTERGARKLITQGREFTLLAAPEPVAAPAPAGPSLPDGFAQALMLMDLIDKRANGQVNGMAQIAAIMATRGGGGGIDGATLQLMLERQNSALTAALAPLADRLARLEGDDEDDEDDDDDDGSPASTIATAARTAGVVYKKGMSAGDIAKALALQHPTEVLEVLKGIPTIVSALADAAKASANAQAHAAVRPRAVLRQAETETPPAPAPEPVPMGPGLNAAASAGESPK